MIWNTRSRCLQRSGSHAAPGPFAALAAHQRQLILRPTRSQPEVTIDFPSSVLDPSRRPAFVLLETVAYKAGATSRNIDEKSNAIFRRVGGVGSMAPGLLPAHLYRLHIAIVPIELETGRSRLPAQR